MTLVSLRRATDRIPRPLLLFIFLLLISSFTVPQEVPKPPKASPWRLPGGIAGRPYNESLAANQPTWKNWKVLSGDVPGLQLQPSGVFAGIPAAEGIFQLSLAATDRRGRATHGTLYIAISSRIGPPTTTTGVPGGPFVSLTACGELESDTSYRLQRDIGTKDGSLCLRLTGPNTHLDLNRHTVHGRIAGHAVDVNGIVIANGSVTCNFGDSETDHGCIELTSEASPQKTLQLRDLTVTQLSTVSDEAARAVHIDWSATSNSLSPTIPSVRLSGITASVSASTGHRSPILGVQGARITAEFDHNQLTCPSGANACQGIVCYGLHVCWVHANRIVLAPNIHLDETARAILFDQLNRKLNDFGEAWNNLVIANQGRAIRVRGAFNIWVHDNRIESVEDANNAQSYIGAIHLGDPDSGPMTLWTHGSSATRSC